MLTIGIDPGATGAIAVYDGTNVSVFDMPSDKIFKGKSAKTRIDLGALSDMIQGFADFRPAMCLIEEQQGIRGQGVDSALHLGRAWMAVEMAIVAHKIPYQNVRPSDWKAALRVPSKGSYPERKAASRAYASQLLPHARHLWPLVADAGKAEATLIALYAHMLMSDRREVAAR